MQDAKSYINQLKKRGQTIHIKGQTSDKIIKSVSGEANKHIINRDTVINHVKESEQLDELSKTTLSNYINHAMTDQYGNGWTLGYGNGKNDKHETNNEVDSIALKNAYNRSNGVKLATKKLTKEDKDFDGKILRISLEQIANRASDLFDKISDAMKIPPEAIASIAQAHQIVDDVYESLVYELNHCDGLDEMAPLSSIDKDSEEAMEKYILSHKPTKLIKKSTKKPIGKDKE